MKKGVYGWLLFGLGLGSWGSWVAPAAASATYSANRSASVRLVWRRSMGRHALTATTGARYSEHLGYWYGNNAGTAQTTWYTDAHEELYEVDHHADAIYYHVHNASGSLQGWIWRGYLKTKVVHPYATLGSAGVVSIGPVAAPTYVAPATNQPFNVTFWDNIPDDNPSKMAAEALDATRIVRAVQGLFPGTVTDPDLTALAERAVAPGDGENDPEEDVPMGDTYLFLRASDGELSSYQRDLAQRGYTSAKLASYAGWHIGLAVQTNDNWGEGVEYGDVAIYLHR